ncbi:hypothetical protein [Salinarimonas ramus]|uniref:Lipoprotein n=1 Tax=Salinarimonas ramus TaxID=690164 RepID=A0A917VAC3_9HYPH|nr:hypothetical protein [Salinarimonas ramus]GGK54071.1 hypothetical protein GCM10011322_46080 [Salinarimonas ramus]
MSGHRGIAASAGLAALLALSGCSSVSGGGGPFSGLFGGGAPEPVESAQATTFEDFVGSDPVACPAPEVIQGAPAFRAYRGGRAGSNQDLRYQISIFDLARECVATPEGQNRIKLGVQGRVLIGPAGAPGSFTAPVRIRVRTTSTVYEDVSRRVSVTVPAGQTIGDFVLVEEGLEVPLSIGDNFIIEAGIEG